jgi:PAS domain S-box-containing protein
MINGETIEALSEFAITSDYFLHATIEKSGKVISSHSAIGPIPTLFDRNEKPIYFADCFLSSDWSKYETQRIKAWKNSHQSFVVELKKISHPELEIVPSKWEFFFISEDFGTCLGIGHLLPNLKPFNIGMGDFFDQKLGEKELLDSLLEDKLIGFWEYDLNTKTDNLSQGLGQMLGYSEEELEKGDKILLQKHVHSEDLPELLRDLSQYFKTSGNVPFRKEFRMYSKNNEMIWVLGFGKTTRWSKEGIPLKVLGCLVDISDKKKQETWMKEHQLFLKELAFEQSHSLRARVANILGILEILEVETKSDESKKLIDLIKDETKRLDQSLKKSIVESVAKNKSLEIKFL